jgi:hypothetical protein
MPTLVKILIGIVVGPPLALVLALAIAGPFLGFAVLSGPAGDSLATGPWPIFVVLAIGWTAVLRMLHGVWGRYALLREDD